MLGREAMIELKVSIDMYVAVNVCNTFWNGFEPEILTNM